MPFTIRPFLGVAYVICAAMLWGTTGASQALAGGSLSSLWFGALRLAFAAFFFLVFAAASGGFSRRAWQGLAPREALGAGLCMASYNLAFFAGVKLTGIGVGTAIALGSGPIWAGLLQAVYLRQPPTGAWWAGTAFAIAGGVLLSVGRGALDVSLTGVAMCLAAGLSYAVYTLLNKRMADHAPASSITLAAFAPAACIALPLAAMHSGVPVLGLRDLAATAYTGVVAAGVAFLLFSQALRHISPAACVSLAMVEPVVAFVLATMVLGEPAGLAALSGLGFIVMGVLGVVRAELVPGRVVPQTEPAARGRVAARGRKGTFDARNSPTTTVAELGSAHPSTRCSSSSTPTRHF